MNVAVGSSAGRLLEGPASKGPSESGSLRSGISSVAGIDTGVEAATGVWVMPEFSSLNSNNGSWGS